MTANLFQKVKVITGNPLYLSAAAVQAALPIEEVYEVVCQTLRELHSDRLAQGRQSGFEIDIDGVSNYMGSVSGCVLSSDAAGIKWYTVSQKNPSRDLPLIQATILVSDPETGLLDGVLEGTQLTPERTAAMGIAASTACARRPLRRAAVIGAGAIGRELVKFLIATQQMDQITVVARKESSARQACDAAASLGRGDTTLCATTDVQQAVQDVDVVYTATNVPEDSDLVRAEWLKDDAIVCSLGRRREVDLDLVAQAWIVVNDPQDHKIQERSDFREGGAGWNRIAADLGSVMSGRLRPPSDATRVHLILSGIGALDVALGARAIANARLKGLGVPLETPSETQRCP